MATTWKTLCMADIMAEFHDGPHATPAPARAGPVYLGIKNITEDGHLDFTDIRHIADADYDRWTKRVEPRPGDLVFTYEASLHRYAVIPEGFRGSLGRRVALIRPKPAIVDTRFLLYVLLSPQWRVTVTQRINIGSTVDRIPLVDFPNFPISLPPLGIQQKIAAVLSAYDDLIENNTRRIKLLEEMAQAIYREWFVDFRYPGHETAPVVASDTGPLPGGWTVQRLAGLVTTQYGYTESASTRPTGPKFLRGMDINKASYIDWSEVPFCPITEGDHTKFRLRLGDILIVRMADPGKVGIVEQEVDAVFASYLVRLRPHPTSSLTPYFLFYYLNSDQYQGFVTGASTGTTRKSLSAKVMTDIDVIVPPASLQQAFADQVAGLRRLLGNLLVQNAALRTTRDLLIPRLISGELDVEDLDIDTSGLAV